MKPSIWLIGDGGTGVEASQFLTVKIPVHIGESQSVKRTQGHPFLWRTI